MSEVYHDAQIPTTKQCSQCHIEKPLSAFHKDAHKKDGYRSACIVCLHYRRKHPRVRPLVITSIVCTSCGVEKPLDCFDKHTKNRLHGHRTVCKDCRRIQRKQTYKPRLTPLPKPVNGGKICRTCMTEKPLEEFCPDKRARDGRSRQCRACVSHRQYVLKREQTMARYHRNVETNGERYKETARQWRQKHRYILSEIARRRVAREKQAAIGEVDYERILLRDGFRCYICGQDILPEHSLEMDHEIPLDRGGAHSEENIHPSHKVCNRRKGTKLLSEMTAHQRRGPKPSHDANASYEALLMSTL
jgi:hypothetical protein